MGSLHRMPPRPIAMSRRHRGLGRVRLRLLGGAEPPLALRELVARSLRPPVRDARFWFIQTLVVLTGALDWWTLNPDHGPLLGVPPNAVLALFLVPVIYAALNFGLAGSLATAAWVVLLVVALTLARIGRQDTWAVVIQLTSVSCVAFFVGQRVEREVIARREAEAARSASWASEARFRSLFESSPAATLLVGPEGRVQEANPAAAALFGRGRQELLGVALSELVGPEPAAAIADGQGPVQELPEGDGGGRYLRPVVSRWPVTTGAGFQVVFLDVSEERRRLGIKDAYAAYVLKAQEEERARIAQELHDEPLQQVVQLCRLLERLDEPRGGDAGRGRLGEARGVALAIADQLRRLARGLRPPALEDLGLVAAMQRLARDLERRTELHVELRVVGDARRLDPPVELGLFRIAQEGLRNVERHAGGSRVDLVLTFAPSQVALSVADDGRGLPAAATLADATPDRLGLIGMQERAALLGGTFRLTSPPSGGTRLEVVIPTPALEGGMPEPARAGEA
jgi:PAS domain S-box-containing protein